MNLKFRTFILFNIIITLMFLFGSGKTSSAQKKPEVKGDFKYYFGIAKMNTEERLQDMKMIEWTDNIVQDEKSLLISFFEAGQNEFELYRLTVISKADLDMDGHDEFILNAVIKNPTPSYFGELLCVFTKTKEGFKLLFKDKPFIWQPTGGRKIETVDFDKDGFKDIVYYTEIEAYGEQPPLVASVYKNISMKNFTLVYEESVHDHLQFADINNDGDLELLEPVLGVKRKGLIAPPPKLWINIYEWTGKTFVDRSEHYLGFYREKEVEYKKILEENSKGTDIISIHMVGIYEEYLKRIEDLMSHNK